MAITKQNKRMGALNINFDSQGNILSIIATVSFEFVNDADPEDTASHRRNVDLWARLAPGKKVAANQLLKELRALAVS